MRAPATNLQNHQYPVHCGFKRHMSLRRSLGGVLVILHRLSANSGRQRVMCTLFRCSGTLPEVRSLSFISLGMDVYLLAA